MMTLSSWSFSIPMFTLWRLSFDNWLRTKRCKECVWSLLCEVASINLLPLSSSHLSSRLSLSSTAGSYAFREWMDILVAVIWSGVSPLLFIENGRVDRRFLCQQWRLLSANWWAVSVHRSRLCIGDSFISISLHGLFSLRWISKFIMFGVVNGFLRRVHRYPLLLPANEKDTEFPFKQLSALSILY